MKRPTILVVDDNVTNLKLACDVLAFDGFDVRRASDAAEAALLIGQALPDLILMDIQMPGIDGLTFTRQLKDDERTRGIVIVALTSSAMIGDEERTRQAGCDGYIAKPIESRKLGQQVSAVYEKMGPAGSSPTNARQ